MNTLLKLTLLTISLSLAILSFQLRHYTPSQPVDHFTLPTPIVHNFCHTDPGVDARQEKRPTSRHCIGTCTNRTKHILPYGIEATRISSLCLSNPFHGFYDCIWPLVHYLSTCLPLRAITAPILTNNEILSQRRSNTWVARAQIIYLNGLNAQLIEKSRVDDKCLCFKQLVKFRKTAFFRPTRFQYKSDVRNSSIVASHASLMKRDGLRAFRRVVLTSLNLPLELKDTLSPIVVYGRDDAPRRIWHNVQDFIEALRPRLPPSASILRITKIPRQFEHQVEQFNQAAMVIAPHGAALANTLFMRPGAAVLEIASKKCLHQGESLDMDALENVSDPNAWVPWHAQSLGLYHMNAPCFMTEKPGGFETDNQSLVKIALLMLMFPRTNN